MRVRPVQGPVCPCLFRYTDLHGEADRDLPVRGALRRDGLYAFRWQGLPPGATNRPERSGGRRGLAQLRHSPGMPLVAAGREGGMPALSDGRHGELPTLRGAPRRCDAARPTLKTGQRSQHLFADLGNSQAGSGAIGTEALHAFGMSRATSPRAPRALTPRRQLRANLWDWCQTIPL